MGRLRELERAEQVEAEELLEAIAGAESVIVCTIERQCEALRAGRMLAARALHTRLCDAAKLYLDASRAARVSIEAIEDRWPGSLARLEDGRTAFSALLKVELAILAAERAAVDAREKTGPVARQAESAGVVEPPAARSPVGANISYRKRTPFPRSRKISLL